MTPKEKKIKNVTYSYGRNTKSVEKIIVYIAALADNPASRQICIIGAGNTANIAAGVINKFTITPKVIIPYKPPTVPKEAIVGAKAEEITFMIPNAVPTEPIAKHIATNNMVLNGKFLMALNFPH